jgi:hypothetical protein
VLGEVLMEGRDENFSFDVGGGAGGMGDNRNDRPSK